MVDHSLPESTPEVVIDSPTTKNHHQPPKGENQERPMTQTITKNEEQPSKPLHASIITKINASYFRICISTGGQALLWKTLSEQNSNISLSPTLHTTFAAASFLLWCLTLFMLVFLSLVYILRCIFHFNNVKAEYYHRVGVNYLFAPSISWLLLLQSTPFIFPDKYTYECVWWLLIIPVLALDVKVYGQWFMTEKRFLSMVANPTIQMTVLGNLVGSHAAVKTGWTESGICLFTFGMTHYLVVFITLYQRLSGPSNHIPSKLRPVFFLFVATPSMATLAWKSINGSFDILCKMLFFLSLFLFVSLASRPVFFKESVKRFSVVWWAFSFPLTFLALASIAYAQQVKGVAAAGLALVLSVISVLVFLSLLVCSILKIHSLLHKPIFCFSTTLGSTNV